MSNEADRLDRRSMHKLAVNPPYLLHIFSATKYVSPFDINMAYEACFDDVIPYCNVTLDEIRGLTQDTIFSRRPEGVRRTGIFIGGRDFDLAVDMLECARNAMVPPFEVSVMVDPSGAFTTAAAMAAIAEHTLGIRFGAGFAGTRACIFGGTGPVGACVAVLIARCGAEVSIVSQRGVEAAEIVAARCRSRYGVQLRGADGGSPQAAAAVLAASDVVFNTARAGVRVVDARMIAGAQSLRVAIDANAVPPSGIEGVAPRDHGLPIGGASGTALGIGALVVGDVKYRVHTGLLHRMYASTKPVYLAYEEAFALAREIVAQG